MVLVNGKVSHVMKGGNLCRTVLALVSSITQAEDSIVAEAGYMNACKVFGVSA